MGGEGNGGRGGRAAGAGEDEWSPEDDVHRGRKVAHHRKTGRGRARRFGGIGPLDQQAPSAEPPGGQHVPQAIAHPPAAGELQPVIRRGTAVQQRARLAALAGPGEIGMVGAVIVGVDPRTLPEESYPAVAAALVEALRE